MSGCRQHESSSYPARWQARYIWRLWLSGFTRSQSCWSLKGHRSWSNLRRLAGSLCCYQTKAPPWEFPKPAVQNGMEKLGPVITSPHFLYLVLELSQEERQQVLYCVVLAQDGWKAHNDRGQSWLHMLVGVWNKFLETERSAQTNR